MKDKCSHCVVKELQESLVKGEQLTFRRADARDASKNGVDIYKHPTKVKTPWMKHDKYFVTWILEIHRKCVC